jgi:hypothetical protein
VPGIEPGASLAVNARRILAVRSAEFFSYAPIVGIEAAIEAHHDMRIAAKRLRYTLELFAVVFGDVGKVQIERIKALQEALGALHDHDVRIELIEDELIDFARVQVIDMAAAVRNASAPDHHAITASMLRPPPDDPRRGLIALLGRQHVARRAQYAAFVDLWERFAAEGMRGELTGLSAAPTAEHKPSAARDRAEKEPA